MNHHHQQMTNKLVLNSTKRSYHDNWYVFRDSVLKQLVGDEFPVFPMISPSDREALDGVLHGRSIGVPKLSFSEEAQKLKQITEFREKRKQMKKRTIVTPSSPVQFLSHNSAPIPVMRPVSNFVPPIITEQIVVPVEPVTKQLNKKLEMENETLQNSIEQLNRRIAALEEIIEIQTVEIDNVSNGDGTQAAESESQLQINMIQR